MNIPDVVGTTLAKAKRFLDAAGITALSVTITSPPRHKSTKYDDSFRVIRLKAAEGGKVELLVCDSKLG
jgi:hypothetical protein